MEIFIKENIFQFQMKKTTSITISENLKIKLDGLRKNEKWDVFLEGSLNKVIQYEREKNSWDRQAHEFKEEIKRNEGYREDLKKRFEEEKSNRVLDLEDQVRKLKQEIDHLGEVLKIRAGY